MAVFYIILSTCFFATFMLVCDASSHANTAGITFESRANLNFQVSGPSSNMPKSLCSLKCLLMGDCVGFQCHPAVGSTAEDVICEPCVMTTVSSISTLTSYSPTDNYLYLAYTQSCLPIVSSLDPDMYYVHVPDGFHADMVIYAQAVPGYSLVIMISEYIRTTLEPVEEYDFVLHVTFDWPNRPMTILVDNYDGQTGLWSGQHESFPVQGFATVGEKTDFIVFISESKYSLFINGKFVLDYQHSRRKPLNDYKCLLVSSDITSVRLFNP